MNKKVERIQERLVEYFQGHPEIEIAYIFGSTIQERTNILSDIDIAIFIDTEKVKEELYPYGYKANLLADLMKLLKTNNIDLVILDEANLLLRHRILYFGRLIYNKNDKKRIQLQIDTFNKYNDFKYFLKTHS